MADNKPLPNPYIGPRAFQTGEKLYGRERELRELLNFLLSQRIVLLYSPSGAGKTSLVQAGLIPSLRSRGFSILPVIRVNLDSTPPDGSRQEEGPAESPALIAISIVPCFRWKRICRKRNKRPPKRLPG